MQNCTTAEILQLAARLATGFRETVATGPRHPDASYAQMLAAFSAPTPEFDAPAEAVIEALAMLAEPGLHATTGPRYFGWVIGASHPVGVAADWLTSAWGQNCANLRAAPAAAAVEAVAAAWLLDLLHLPTGCTVGFVTGGTVANFVCLAAARSEVLRRAGWDVESDGLFGAPPIQVYVGDDAHTTVFSALQMLGMGRNRVNRIPTDAAGRMEVTALARSIEASDAPKIVIAQAGQINTGAFDPFDRIAPLAHEGGAWLHIDGAFGLWARACPEVAEQARGADLADSWATDGHKWLQVPYDCGYAIVRNGSAHRRAMTTSASYLPSPGEGEREPTDYVPELSRRARGFATWAMIRHLGRQGIAAMVARHCNVARRMAARLQAESGVAVLDPVTLNQVIARFGTHLPPSEGDLLTRKVIAQVQADGVCYVGGAQWRDRWVMRLSVISWPTTEADGDRAVEAILSAYRASSTPAGDCAPDPAPHSQFPEHEKP